MYVGIASLTEICVGNELAEGQCVNNVVNTVSMRDGDKGRSETPFELYLDEKLGHLTAQERSQLEPVLRKYNYLFYEEGSLAVGCTSVVKYTMDTGDAQLIKKNLYKTEYIVGEQLYCVSQKENHRWIRQM
jgi:hypothetical protein